ncbi:hypothetical protein KIPB_007014, partial [Kipferlia bialata]
RTGWKLAQEISNGLAGSVNVAMEAGLLVAGWPDVETMLGRADVYRLDGDEYRSDAYLSPPSTRGQYGFGDSVAISACGTRIVIGSGHGGYIDVFDFAERNWTLTQSMQQDYYVDEQPGFHLAISSDGHTIAQGCSEDGDQSHGGGSVHILSDLDGDGFVLTQTLSVDNTSGLFGQSLVFSEDSEGQLLAIGAPGDAPTVYLYGRDTTTGEYSQVDYETSSQDTALGEWVDISGYTLLAGMPTFDEGAHIWYSKDGSVGVFDIYRFLK